MDDFYTRLYVDTDQPRDAVVHWLAQGLVGQVELFTVVVGPYEIDVRKSSAGGGKADEDDFLAYSISVEVVAVNVVELDDYLVFVSRVMLRLAEMGANVVASSNHEERLIGSGRVFSVRTTGPGNR